MITLSATLSRYSNLLKPVGRIFNQGFCVENSLRTMAYIKRYEPRGSSSHDSRHEPRAPPRFDSYDQMDFRTSFQGANQYCPDYDDGYKTFNEMQDRTWQEPSVSGFTASNTDSPVTVTCGDLRPSDSGLTVSMSGRIQYQRLGRFLSLRDSYGTIQLVALEERMDLIKQIRNIPIDSHIKVIGEVAMRPIHTVNPSMATGEIEVVIHKILDVAPSKRRNTEISGEDSAGPTGKKSRSSTLLTSAEVVRCESEAVKKRFLQRSHNCGELEEAHNRLNVKLCGWIDSKRSDRFALLRDGYGTTQLVLNPNDLKTATAYQQADSNSIIMVEGTVMLRPYHQRNTRMATGSIEVKVSSLVIVNPNEPVEESNDEIKMKEGLESSGVPPGDQNSYSSRTHNCEQLRGSHVGQNVVLCGWLNSQRGGRFGNIRDGYGSTQLLVPPELDATVGKTMGQTPLESVIRVAGTVVARPPEQVTDKLTTGEIEVVVKEYTVLNPAKKDLPFIVRDHNRPKENLRMKYRYLDLRFSDMQYRLRLRSKVLMKMREFLINQRGFVEVETPTLFRRTPGGAQEYVVPTRTEGRFYSLVQSPQQLKQLLMVGAMDRYFQVARCYRDEGARPDRQPEFTQMDIELSFTDRESIMRLIEELVKASWPEDFKPLHIPFPVYTYHDVMHWYGTDKPDLSFDKKLLDISECLAAKTDYALKALVFTPNNAVKLAESFKSCQAIMDEKQQTNSRLIMIECGADGWKNTLKHQLSFLDTNKLANLVDLSPPCTLVVGVGPENEILPLMGKLRQDVFGSVTSNFHFAWVVDFPLFLQGENGEVESAHHPFTQVHPEDAHLLQTQPLKVRGLHFDLVCNGYEVGGGSVRIFDSAEQTRVLQDILQIPTDSLTHLLEALSSGAPPHGGIALGIDRLLSIMVGAESIRDVIAFPKGFDGKDPLCGAPCPITDEEKRLYHLLPRKPRYT